MKKAIISNIGMDNLQWTMDNDFIAEIRCIAMDNLQWTMDNDFIVEIGCIAMDNIFYSLNEQKLSIVIYFLQ